MTLLSKCSGTICGRKESCLRYTSTVHDPKTQSWINPIPTGECEYFVSNGIPVIEPKLKIEKLC